ncbi:hypothetical protein [Burkholderia ubonensis]|uniref:ATP-dependent serine protease n=1 Tax=Burkholderia ubonensis subsp. mesacidophila TaxID=265293 RepID=A0A2A4FH48_9BURK|nr:hypothetical protein [Burkholderia ubonensis]PCE32455.1 hypothetical protein BZL54_10665 [Burkholderia ubonensis subsp. mesacidophila]
MRVLLNRKVIARDTLTGALNAHARSRQAACYRCRECGFVAFRALEHCPVCGMRNWPFDARAVSPARPPFDSWPMRIARSLHHAAIHQPRASSAPLLSLVTLVLVFGGYVAFDKMCQADPVCRAPDLPSATVIIGGLRAPAERVTPPGDPALPMPPPAYPFYSLDEEQLAANTESGPSAGQAVDRTIASAAPADAQHPTTARAPDAMVAARPCTARAAPGCAGAHAAPIRTAELRNRPFPTHHTHGIRRVGARPEPGRRPASNEMDLARLYRGH